MPDKLICCVSLTPATIHSVPIYNFMKAHEELAGKATEEYFPCCGKSVCGGCAHSFHSSGTDDKCPFCNSDRNSKTVEEQVAEVMKRVVANDAASIYMLADCYYQGLRGFQQDRAKGMELYDRAIDLGYTKAHNKLAAIYHEGGNLKKAKFHWEAASMAGDEAARYNLGNLEAKFGNMERAAKHWTIAAFAGHYTSMFNLLVSFNEGLVSRESINTALAAYNNSCAEMRSEARDAYILAIVADTI